MKTGCSGITAEIGDNFCDDGNNNQECNYDSGDCCGYNVDTQYCTECICFEDLSCTASLSLIGDGYCDDEANMAVCTYDGGDCCGECINTELCTECICQEGGEPAIDYSCKPLKVIHKPHFLECNIK